MNTINYKIAQLLEKNRDYFGRQPIAFDGVVDEETYKETEIKTIFLLKEVNEPGMTEDWTDFMEAAKQQAYKDSIYKTWYNVCLWIKALRNPNLDYNECLDELSNFATEKLQKSLLEVGVVNIKKTAGNGSSKAEEILSAAATYGHVICQEIEKYIQPDLVICGGTFNYAKVMFDVKEAELVTLPSGAQYFTRNNIVYLEFVHPMWFSVNRKILFAYAKIVFAEVRELFNK